METAFNKGDKIVARKTVQNMIKGHFYVVVDLNIRCTPFGNFVNYLIRREGERKTIWSTWWVGNLHLLADKR